MRFGTLMVLVCGFLVYQMSYGAFPLASQTRLAEFSLDCDQPGHPTVCIEGIALVEHSGDGFRIQESFDYHSFPINNIWKPASWASASDPSIMVDFNEDTINRPWGSIVLFTQNITSTQYISVTMRAPNMTNYFPPLLAMSTVGSFTVRTAPKSFTMIATPHRYYDSLMGREVQLWMFNYLTDTALTKFMSVGCINILKGATEADRQSVVLDGKSLLNDSGGPGSDAQHTLQSSSGQISLGLSQSMLDAIDFEGRFPHDYLQSSACQWGAQYSVPDEGADPIETDDFVAELAGVDLETTATIYPDAVEITIQNASGGSSRMAAARTARASTNKLNLYAVTAQTLTAPLGDDVYIGQTIKLPTKTDQKQPVNWTSNTAYCTITKGTLNAASAGECSVTATATAKGRLKPLSQSYTFDVLPKQTHVISAALPASVVGTNQTPLPATTDAGATISWKVEKSSSKMCSLKKISATTYLVGKSTGDCAYRGSVAASTSHDAYLSAAYTTAVLAKLTQTTPALSDMTVGAFQDLPLVSAEGITVQWKATSKTCKVIKLKVPPYVRVQATSTGMCTLGVSNRGDASYQPLSATVSVQVN